MNAFLRFVTQCFPLKFHNWGIEVPISNYIEVLFQVKDDYIPNDNIYSITHCFNPCEYRYTLILYGLVWSGFSSFYGDQTV